MPLGERSLIYVKGGYSNGKFDALYDSDVTDNDDEEPGAILDFSEKQGGFHLGGGAEVGLTDSLYVKLEYVYTDYGSRSYLIEEVEEGDDTLSTPDRIATRSLPASVSDSEPTPRGGCLRGLPLSRIGNRPLRPRRGSVTAKRPQALPSRAAPLRAPRGFTPRRKASLLGQRYRDRRPVGR